MHLSMKNKSKLISKDLSELTETTSVCSLFQCPTALHTKKMTTQALFYILCFTTSINRTMEVFVVSRRVDRGKTRQIIYVANSFFTPRVSLINDLQYIRVAFLLLVPTCAINLYAFLPAAAAVGYRSVCASGRGSAG